MIMLHSGGNGVFKIVELHGNPVAMAGGGGEEIHEVEVSDGAAGH